jgi:formylglycine-generating enzyme required for sulfatase activity
VRSGPIANALREERDARARLLEDRRLVDLVFVPEVSDLEVHAVYMQRHDVTNAEFRDFVRAGGYRELALWDAEGRRLLPTFRDDCPGGDCNHLAPRAWVGGDFGDAANAQRPVRGVSVYEARAYAAWLSTTTGARWRLPTDAEWRVAAGWDPERGLLSTYPWGESLLPELGERRATVPRPVGEVADDVSKLGIVDVGTNVREWVAIKDGTWGTKGCDFGSDVPTAAHFARVSTTGAPGANPSAGVLKRIGFRLVREVEAER